MSSPLRATSVEPHTRRSASSFQAPSPSWSGRINTSSSSRPIQVTEHKHLGHVVDRLAVDVEYEGSVGVGGKVTLCLTYRLGKLTLVEGADAAHPHPVHVVEHGQRGA